MSLSLSDFSFQEKSAWGSLVAILATSHWYFSAALAAGDAMTGEELVRMAIGAVVVLIVVEIAYHVAIGIASPDEAEADERDRLIAAKASGLPGYVLGGGVYFAIAQIAASGVIDPAESSAPFLLTQFATAHILVGSLVFAQIAEYVMQLYYYRTSV